MWVRNKLGMQIPRLFQVCSISVLSLFHLCSYSNFVPGQTWNTTYIPSLFQFCSNKIQLKKFRISVAWTHFLAQYPTRYMRVEIWQLHIVKPLTLTSAPRKTHQLVMRTGCTSIPPSICSDEAPSPSTTQYQLLWARRKKWAIGCMNSLLATRESHEGLNQHL